MISDSPTSIDKPPRLSGLATEEHAALCRSWPLPAPHSSRVWKPHGWLLRPKTLHLGDRDFGLQWAGSRWAFGHHEAVERDHATNKSTHSETRVARVLRYERRAIGLGLGRDEWGLHWLLARRACDRAGKKPERPFTSYIEIRESMPIRVGHSGHPSWGKSQSVQRAQMTKLAEPIGGQRCARRTSRNRLLAAFSIEKRGHDEWVLIKP